MSSTVNDYKTGEFIRIATPTDNDGRTIFISE